VTPYVHEINLPSTYWVAAGCLAVGGLIVLVSARRSWAPGYAAVLATVFAWYFIEPLYLPREFIWFEDDVLFLGYLSVTIFLVSFMLAAAPMIAAFSPKRPPHLREPSTGWSRGITVEKLVWIVCGVWLVLLAYGVFRVDGDVVGALFSTGSRSGEGVAMFGRAGGANAGATGFIISTADYLYRLCLGAFGLLLPIARKPRTRLFLIGMIVLTWPYVFFSGTRNIALAVVAPVFASFMLYSRVGLVMKGVVFGVGFFAIEFVMRAMVALRNQGFDNFDLSRVEETKHLGLNMASELMYVTTFIQNGVLELKYGGNYLAHAANIIPRAIWPGKPLVGIDYAIARGFGGADNDLGIFATIATGLIGQGVIDFGNFVGPVVTGMLMAMWVGILNHMRVYGGLPRTGLFLIGLGLTFNLGREITLLVLFPFIFGYIAVRLLDNLERRRSFAEVQTSASFPTR
jgi:oligosaccharide repeat unit polymerase